MDWNSSDSWTSDDQNVLILWYIVCCCCFSFDLDQATYNCQQSRSNESRCLFQATVNSWLYSRTCLRSERMQKSHLKHHQWTTLFQQHCSKSSKSHLLAISCNFCQIRLQIEVLVIRIRNHYNPLVLHSKLNDRTYHHHPLWMLVDFVSSWTRLLPFLSGLLCAYIRLEHVLHDFEM